MTARKSGPSRRARSGPGAAPEPPPREQPPEQSPVEAETQPRAIVGIGASAGGLEAFSAFLEAMPPDTGLAFVFVLHMAPGHHSLLAEILSRVTSMRVTEVQQEVKVEPNHVYVIPPGRAMIIEDGMLKLSPRPEAAQHRSVDGFFSSLAAALGHRSIGVILSGTATDGTIGLEAIKVAGGLTFAQDASALHDGMPQSAISSGCVDLVLSPADIAREIAPLGTHPYIGGLADDALARGAELEDVLAVLREESGVDFGQYKSSTLNRRINRRMVLHKFPSLGEYADYLRKNVREIEALYHDILISVTSFFRDPEAFESLKTLVLPEVFKDRSQHDTVRLWVLGCSTGEEAYSMAIALKEYAAAIASPATLVVYATDLNSAVIEKARAAWYPDGIARDVSPERLRRFFVEGDGGYRVAKAIREICVFARQNVLADPPFSRMDVVTCRNVLIYLQPPLQRRLLPILHYALKPSGFLFLGPSETTGTSRELFAVVDGKHKLFRKLPAATPLDEVFPLAPRASPSAVERRPPDGGHPSGDNVTVDLQREADRTLISRFVPAGVLVNDDLNVLQFRGDTGLYLAPAPGRPSTNLLKLARDGLLLPLRSAFKHVKKEDLAVREERVKVRSNGGFRDITLSIIPVKQPASKARCYWVLFEPSSESRAQAPRVARAKLQSASARRGALEERDEQIARSAQELAATRDYLQSVIEQQDAVNEELQSANEEVQSGNEELQSINEELETSKEEIQSTNEELTTVNEELRLRNEELNRANSDLNNLFSSAHIAIVMVSPDQRIRRFTPLAEKLFNLIASDVGRPFSHIKLDLNIDDLPHILGEVIDSASVREMEVRDSQGRWYFLRIRPYRALDNRVDGAVISLVDIDAVKQNQETLARQAQLLEQTHEAVFVRDLSGGAVRYWNRGAERLYGFSRDEATGRDSSELLRMTPEQARSIREALERDGQWIGEEGHRTKDDREIVVESDQVVFKEAEGTLVLESNRDVSERTRLQGMLQRRVEELATTDRHRNEFLAMLAHELRNPLAPLRNAVEILRSAARSPEHVTKARDLIDRQVTKLARLVDDLLDAARITRGQIQLRKERVELQGVMQRAIETTQHMLEVRRQQLEVTMPSAPIVVDADPLRLEQVFSNLLNNASKYMREAGRIAVTVDGSDRDQARGAREVAVRFRDSGIGIAPEMLPHVFELFTQADRSLARTEAGLGIGLSLVRSIVQLHGGRVIARSDGIDRGSEFVVYLPVVHARQAKSSAKLAAAPAQAGDGGVRPARVLVVDDNPDIVESTRMLLTLQGHTTYAALSGAKALELASSVHPTVVIIDIGMPGMDGYTVARRLREQPGLEDMFLVAMSGYGRDQDRARSLEAGFDRHLTKPVDLEELQRLVAQAHSQPRRLKMRYGTSDDISIKPRAAAGPQDS